MAMTKFVTESATATMPALLTPASFASRSNLDLYSPVNENGCFEFDRVLKSGYVQKRTQKTKTWKPIYLVLRPNSLSIYKSDKEEKLRHSIYLSDVTAVAHLKDPKHKRQNVFGLFSPSRNFHFQAPSLEEAQDWVNVIRTESRVDEEEQDMFLASPAVRRLPHLSASNVRTDHDREAAMSSSPEPVQLPVHILTTPALQDVPSHAGGTETSAFSGNELASHSDFSDTDAQNLAVQATAGAATYRLGGSRNVSQLSGLNNSEQQALHDPDRVIWQGWLWLLRSKGGVRQWKNSWAVLRPRNLILYKNESEYSAQFIVPLSLVLNVVDIDPLSRTKKHCLQLITEEKCYRLCAHDEEGLVRCLGAFKSLLAKRREVEKKAAASAVPVVSVLVTGA